MNNSFNNLPSYIQEAPKYSRFLKLVNSYILSAAVEVSRLKESFLWANKSSFVIQSLSSQLGVTVDIPFEGGVPNWTSYYKRLYNAYRAGSFTVSFKGDLSGFTTGDPLKDITSLVVLDFSVAKGDYRKPMAVVYSCLSLDENLTLDIVRDYLIPKVTGVSSNLYYLQFGQDVFGYDIDERFDSSNPSSVIGKRVVYPSGVPTEELFESDGSKGYFIRGFDQGTFVSISSLK